MTEKVQGRCHWCGVRVSHAFSLAWRNEQDVVCSDCLDAVPQHIVDRLSGLSRIEALWRAGYQQQVMR